MQYEYKNYNNTLNRLPQYYKEHLGDDLLELAYNCQLLYKGISNKLFEWDTADADKTLWAIKKLVNRIDI